MVGEMTNRPMARFMASGLRSNLDDVMHRLVGLNAIDIIDFDYPYWHTLEDTVDKCSPYTLGIVGTLVCEYLYRKEHD